VKLAETLVAGAVALVLGLVVAWVLAPSLRAWQRTDDRSDLLGSALVLLNDAAASIRRSSADQVAVFPHADGRDALACRVPRADAVAANGAPAWLGWHILIPVGTEMWRLDIDDAALSEPLRRMLAEGTPSDPRMRLVTRGVARFSVEGNRPFRIAVETFDERYRTELRTAAIPILEVLP